MGGVEYTGCLAAASMAAAFLLEERAAPKGGAIGIAALAAGVWPVRRNLVWTGDPVFPSRSDIAPEPVNAYALASYLADTGARNTKDSGTLRHSLCSPRSIWRIWDSGNSSGRWCWHSHRFDPCCARHVPVANRARDLVGSAVLIGAKTGMTRFLLPVLPIASSSRAAGVAQLKIVDG